LRIIIDFPLVEQYFDIDYIEHQYEVLSYIGIVPWALGQMKGRMKKQH
jgi:hypothetical protein